MALKQRWWAHIACSNKNSDTRRPILNAIRKYGSKSFKFVIIQDGLTKNEACQAERFYIWLFDTIAPKGYNITLGGDIGSGRVFWDRIDADPVAKAAYLAKLSNACKNGGHMKRIDVLLAATKAWREGNPEKVKEASARGGRTRQERLMADPVRAAAIAANKVTAANRVPQSEKAYHAARTRDQALAQWAARTEEEKASVALSISKSRKAWFATLSPEEKAARDAQLAVARKKTDRVKWAAAIDAGRKAYWSAESRAARSLSK